jgi:dCMP deaminase
MVFDKALSRGRWDTFFMDMADLVATKSKDRSTKVGAVAVGEGHTLLSMGYNGFVRYCNDEDEARHERPEKYFWSAHAEMNVICNAARNGTKLLDATLYTTIHPCIDCARAIVQAGFKEVVIPSKDGIPFWGEGHGDWGDETKKAQEILLEGHVRMVDHVV